jgi:hypothetical protein
MKVDYSQAKVYKITNDFNNDVWIGTTCDSLVKKFSVHKADAIRNFRKNCIIQKLIKEHGFDRFRIQLIEEYPCEDLYQLRQRQGHHIREMKAINKYADGKDYYEKNKELAYEHHKEYIQKPEVKARIKEYRKEYRQKPEVKQKYNEYRQQPEVKQKLKEYKQIYDQKPEVKERNKNRKSQIVVCECGCSLRRDNISNHKKTKIHLNSLAQKEMMT